LRLLLISMPNDSPVRSRRSTRRRDDAATRHFFADALEQPFGAIVTLQFLESVALVAEAALEVCGPFRYSNFGQRLLVLAEVVVACEGEVGGVLEVRVHQGRGRAWEGGLEV
jgi:hypothetical protein